MFYYNPEQNLTQWELPEYGGTGLDQGDLEARPRGLLESRLRMRTRGRGWKSYEHGADTHTSRPVRTLRQHTVESIAQLDGERACNAESQLCHRA